ncbi:MAG: aldo/keto reductase [Candidatus Nanopelagicales bacterium]
MSSPAPQPSASQPSASPRSVPAARRIGDRSVNPIGLGAMPLSDRAMLDHREQALDTVATALDAGITLLDTADIYAPDGSHFGHNEELIGEAVRHWAGDPSTLVIATKGGITRVPGRNGDRWGRAGRPEQLLAAAEASLARLGGDAIDLYYLHRLDPAVPFDDQIGGLAAIRDTGVARQIGLSNVSLTQLTRAVELLSGPDDNGIVAVQNEYSPRFRAGGDVLEACASQGIAFVPWSPLGGAGQAGEVGSRYVAFDEVALSHGASAQQVALAWLLGLAPVVIPIPGSRRPATISSSAAAAGLELTPEEMTMLNATQPLAESNFPDHTPDPPM